jgi:pimeloyl-ACP methyl ester carboxylesterase
LLGHSEGGYVAPIVAADDARVGFMILLGASAHRGRDMLLLQRAAMNRGEVTPEHEVRVDSAMLAVFFEVFDTRLEDAALPVAVDSALAAWLRSLEGAERGVAMGRLAERTAAADSQSLALWRSPWFRGLYRHDPETFLRRTDVPVLAVVGALDLQVPAHASAQRFRALYDGARANLLTLHTPAGVNHMLQPARTGRMEEYAQTEITIADSVLQLLDTWLAATVPVSSTASEVR